MSKPKYQPINPETEIDRKGIVKLADTSLTRLDIVTKTKKYGFPDALRPGPLGIKIYSLNAVMAWLKENDLKNMKFSAEDRLPKTSVKQIENRTSATQLMRQLTIGIRPAKFDRTGQTITVHVEERNEIERPHPQLTRFSHSGVEHFAHIGVIF